MKNSKNKRTAILSIILLGLLVLAYKVVFMPPSDDTLVEENTAIFEKVEAILIQIESIDFDISVIKDQKIKSLRSIETPLISLPIGKRNPFSGYSGSN